jgi:hypothetical protein
MSACAVGLLEFSVLSAPGNQIPGVEILAIEVSPSALYAKIP